MSLKQGNPLTNDLDYILSRTENLWEELRGSNVFITGGTGFFGCWLLESFIWANKKLGLNASATVLSRNPEAFRVKAPHLFTDKAIHFHPGDVRNFDFPHGKFSHIVHAATEASATLNVQEPLLMMDVIVEGTRRVLEFSRVCGAEKLLLTSSGAVYGKQPAEVSHIPEEFTGGPDFSDPLSIYAEGKRIAELICAVYHAKYGIQTKIARCFAFVGPYLPLDIHFAIGNFIRDAIAGGPIRVKSDGTAYRSYLYAADLAIWLWTILLKGKTGRAYNVGSESSITIGELATLVAQCYSPRTEVIIEKAIIPGQKPQRYVPSTKRSTVELALGKGIEIEDAINRTIDWHRNKGYTSIC